MSALLRCGWLAVLVLLSAGAERPYLEAAKAAGRWLEAVSVDRPEGRAWRPDPAQEGPVVHHLYSGTAGVVLFFLELHDATGEDHWLEVAQQGADALVAEVGDGLALGAGLYTGAAGVAFALEETFRSGGRAQHRAAAQTIARAIQSSARKHDRGVDWSDVTDVISGTSGTGFFLRYASNRWDDPELGALAVAAGLRLLDLAETTEHGKRWRMSPTYERTMPNFSHGTAGVACFLATLAESATDQGFLEAALAGARQLEALATTEEDQFAVHHHAPGGEDLFYLGWCHGPVGTTRLFVTLEQRTHDSRWRDLIQASARTLTQSGIPEQTTPGFWNNVGQCCGSAGVAEYFLDLNRMNRSEPYQAFARRLMDDVLTRATADDQGLRWVQAEHRARPELLQAQTGYMQGAAGIGLALLRLDGLEQHRPSRIVFPDSPY